MLSNNEKVRKWQDAMRKEIDRADATYQKKRARIKELYPADYYGTKADMLIGNLDDKYGPMIREMKWYAMAFSELVDMKEGKKNEKVHV